jgi:hypothetical protein
MSRLTTAAINPTLTTYAQGLAQDIVSALAEFFAPNVVVGATAGKYKQYDDKNAFLAYAETRRAIGGPATRLRFAATDGTYNCEPHALEIPIDDEERRRAGDQQDRLERAKTKALVTTSVVSKEDRVLTVVKNNVSAVADKGVWSNAANDPITEINEQILAVAKATGMYPNRLALGLGAWAVLRDHPKVIARQPGAELIGLSLEQLAKMLLNPAMEVKVGMLSKTTGWGLANSKSNIVGDEVFVFLGSANSTEYDPSALKTFTAADGSVTAVRVYRDENARSDILAVDYSEQIVLTGSACIKRITIK